mmetsp:Transcript_105605/g.274908  ORF Transcript_105605/g.274908 Transcript_105605/m.274908 type:complete len:205 (-) Transcript_105605:412-1026(-)
MDGGLRGAGSGSGRLCRRQLRRASRARRADRGRGGGLVFGLGLGLGLGSRSARGRCVARGSADDVRLCCLRVPAARAAETLGTVQQLHAAAPGRLQREPQRHEGGIPGRSKRARGASTEEDRQCRRLCRWPRCCGTHGAGAGHTPGRRECRRDLRSQRGCRGCCACPRCCAYRRADAPVRGQRRRRCRPRPRRSHLGDRCGYRL